MGEGLLYYGGYDEVLKGMENKSNVYRKGECI